MTSKEFVRRCNSFASLDRAAKYFLNFDLQGLFRLQLIYIDGNIYEDFVLHTSVGDADSDFCNHVWFDRFTRADFLIQLKFFKGFLSRLSKYQTEVIQHDTRFTNLFNYLFNEKK